MRGFHFPLEEQQFHYSATNLIRQDHDRINITQIQVSTPHRWFHFTMQTGWRASVCKTVNAFGLKPQTVSLIFMPLTVNYLLQNIQVLSTTANYEVDTLN